MYKDAHILFSKKKEGKRRKLFFSPLLLLLFFSPQVCTCLLQRKEKSQRKVAVEERSYLPFPRSFAFFSVPLPAQASPEENVRKGWRYSFFQGKRKSQRMMTSEACMYLPFRRSSSFFFLFFPFIYTHRHNPFRLRLLLPGWCPDQPRGGWGFHPLESVRKRVFDPLRFFRGRVEPKDR